MLKWRNERRRKNARPEGITIQQYVQAIIRAQLPNATGENETLMRAIEAHYAWALYVNSAMQQMTHPASVAAIDKASGDMSMLYLESAASATDSKDDDARDYLLNVSNAYATIGAHLCTIIDELKRV